MRTVYEEILRPAGFVDFDECRRMNAGKPIKQILKKKLRAMDERLKARQTKKQRMQLFQEIAEGFFNGGEFWDVFVFCSEDEEQGSEFQNVQTEFMTPYAMRGERVIRGAVTGGATRKGAFKVSPEEIKKYLQSFLPKSATLTRARERTAQHLGVSLRTVNNHTKEFRHKKPD